MIETTEWRTSEGLTLPRSPGAYLLDLELRRPLHLQVGRLGEWMIRPGRYAYVGSARGPGGLSARVGRHLNPTGRQHWHIDALSTVASIVRVYTVASEQSMECSWVHWLLAQPRSSVPVPGFGSSDCRHGCTAHLVCIAPGLDPTTWQPSSDMKNGIRKQVTGVG